LRKNEALSSRYDVEMQDVERLRAYDRVECHVVLYPYNRQVSSDDIYFYPYEEYIKDVLSNQRSAYAEIRNPSGEIFGLLLGLVLTFLLFLFRRGQPLLIESIVSIIGAYAIGKELWGDIESMLGHISKNWPLRYRDSYYRYRLEKHTTLTSYSYLAKEERYGKAALLPEKIDFIKQSNSQTLRMCFDTRDIAFLEGPLAHIHSIHIEPTLMEAFQAGGFMFGIKLSFCRRFLCLHRCFEVFQSINRDAIGCLDETGQWIEGSLFYRHTLNLGRLKLYMDRGIIRDEAIIDASSCVHLGCLARDKEQTERKSRHQPS
jgi:hypothetical protein